jgi:hypothetical protein
MLRGAGHRQCGYERVDLTERETVPGAPFDLVYARLLLYRLPQRVTVLMRLWDAVAPGGHLLVQDYDIFSSGVLPALASMEECLRVAVGAFSAARCHVRVGVRLPQLFRADRDRDACRTGGIAGCGSQRPRLETPICPRRTARPAVLAVEMLTRPDVS